MSFRLRLTSRQLAGLSAVVASDRLKCEVIEATTYLPVGTTIRVAERAYQVGRQVGSGLLGVAYEATPAEGSEELIVKRARARFEYFRQAFELEARVARALASHEWIEPAPILAAAPWLLVKPRYRQPTLLQMQNGGGVAQTQREALVAALRGAGDLAAGGGPVLDLSPKNLCWVEGKWVLLDSGPKLHVSDFEGVLERPGWDSYWDYFRPKLTGSRSEPSALHRGQELDVQARQWAFVKEWWRWFPLDPRPDSDYFFVCVDETVPEPEFLFLVEGETVCLAPEASAAYLCNPWLRRVAQEQWRLQTGRHLRLPGEASALPLSGTPPTGPGSIVAEGPRMGLAKALRRGPWEPCSLSLPRLAVSPYRHWTDLVSQGQATDVYCHELFHPQAPLAASVHLRPPFADDRLVCDLFCLDGGIPERAVMLVPGFRVGPWDAWPLARDLMRRGLDATYVLSRLGVINPAGQCLVTGGSWETVLLVSALDYLSECLGVEEVVLVAASAGAAGAIMAAWAHPLVTGLVLDCPIRRPFALLEYLCRSQQRDFRSTLEEVGLQGLPNAPFQLEFPRRPGLEGLCLHRHHDEFQSVCGRLEGDTEVFYPGVHAQTMRHDSLSRGVPEECLNAIEEFLVKLWGATVGS